MAVVWDQTLRKTWNNVDIVMRRHIQRYWGEKAKVRTDIYMRSYDFQKKKQVV